MRRCPDCNGTSHVVDSREAGHAIVRRRRCQRCGNVWRTYETISLPQARQELAEAAERLRKVLHSSNEAFQQIRDEIDRLRQAYGRD